MCPYALSPRYPACSQFHIPQDPVTPHLFIAGISSDTDRFSWKVDDLIKQQTPHSLHRKVGPHLQYVASDYERLVDVVQTAMKARHECRIVDSEPD